jgi:hypothetical protein
MKKVATKNLAFKSIGMFVAVAGVSLLIFTGCTQAHASEESILAEAAQDTSDDIAESSPFNISPETLLALQTKRDIIRQWAPLCPDGTQNHGECPFRDMAIFSGMACLAGETARCDDVRKSQGPDGRWWRSPGLVGDDTKTETFSRDQSKGVLAYLVATKDVEAAKRWQAYIESNNGKMCNVKKTKDNRCTITQGSSRLFGAVWGYLGLKPAKWMNRGAFIAKFYDPIQAMVQADNFPMHLSAASAWIRLEIERRGGPIREKVDKKVLKILVRREPKNPYFVMLKNGPTNEVAEMILNKCPDTKPDAIGLDWSWQRSQKLKKGQTEYVWQHASGHDCIYIINVFERELALKNLAPKFN